jgi:hypothetical protein
MQPNPKRKSEISGPGPAQSGNFIGRLFGLVQGFLSRTGETGVSFIGG